MPPPTLSEPDHSQRVETVESFYDAVSVLSPYNKHAAAVGDSEDELDPLAHHSPPILVQSSTSSSPVPISPNPRKDRAIETQDESDAERELDQGMSKRVAAQGPETQKGLATANWEDIPLQQLSVLRTVPYQQLVLPKSQYDGYVAPLPVTKERTAVQDLLNEIRQLEMSVSPSSHPVTSNGEFLEIELSNFAVYLPENAWHPFELRGLQNLASLAGHSCLLFDGILNVGEARRYVQGVPFKVCSIGNYGEDIHEVKSEIWIQSDINSKSEVYYKLSSPSSEYVRFHEGFLWLADLAKHFVDYCQASERSVSLHDFRSDFSQWVQKTHKESSSFQSWYQKYARHDFRHAICRNIDFLFKESIGVDEALRSLPIWSELLEKNSIKEHPIKEMKTVVTPYVYECFAHLRFGSHLKAVEPIKMTESRQTLQGQMLDLTANAAPRHCFVEIPASKTQALGIKSRSCGEKVAVEIPGIMDPLFHRQRLIKAVKVGDVISVTKDAEGSVWKDEISRWKAADDCWYVLVQGIHDEDGGEKSFDGIWLYKPADTSCAKMKYPFSNELFLSDNCTCSKGRIMEDEFLDMVKMEWHGHPKTGHQDFFIRQTYIENERFVTLEEEHKVCEHLSKSHRLADPKSTRRYPIGQTVLVQPRQKSKYGLEIYEIVKYISKGTKQYILLRRLQRRSEIDGRGKPNELVYTEKKDKVLASRVHRTCLVRFYKETDVEGRLIPAPYNRDGTGNAFYITTRLIEKTGIATLQPLEGFFPKTLIQGFDPSEPPSHKLLRGMDLYCGGGNFGRGLEEGGAVKNEYAVDINQTAIYTYAANLLNPSTTKLYFGSVDDLLIEALQGNPKKIDSVPLPGDVDFISAGSPCQGFSLLNNHRDGEKALKNQSLVASVAAYVDLYRPKYGLLENVMNMAQKGVGRDEDVLSQLICSLVGMGYQTRLFVLDSWSSGSPQSRSRIFISFAAPGLVTLQHPALSHSHPPNVANRGLGKLANGESFGRRLHDLTPFNYITSSESIRDLPSIGDGRTYQCTPFPDHIERDSVTAIQKLQIEAIPRYPRGSSFVKAWNEGKGTMTKEARLFFPPEITKLGGVRHCVAPSSRAWERLHPDKLFGAVTGGFQMQDGRSTGSIHFEDNRVITIMEARRAQTLPDDEVLIGSRAQIWKVIGNSVARSVSTALGLALRTAWMKNSCDDHVALGDSTISSLASKSDSNEKDTLEAQVSLGEGVAQDLTHPIQVNSPLDIEPPTEYMGAPFLTISKLNGGKEPKEEVAEDHPHIIIPDSVVTSDHEDDVSIRKFRRVLGSLSIESSIAEDKVALLKNVPRFADDSSGKARSLKRPHESTRILPPQRSHKTPRISGQESQYSSSGRH